MTTTYRNLSIAAIILAAALFVMFSQRPYQVEGSVTLGNEYLATTTDTQANFPNYRNILNVGGRPSGFATTTPGVLGSLIIETTGTSPFCLYDATSTKSTGDPGYATTTLACFPASPTVGTYTFDVQVRYGILIEWTGSPTATTRASSTITYRRMGSGM